MCQSNTIFVLDKTKLIAFVNIKLKNIPPIESFLNPVSLSNTKIQLSDRAEHVGVIRESTDIFPHILNHITAHKKASSLIKFSSSSNTNVTSLWAHIRAEMCFCTPILLSGLSSLIINNTNMNYLETYFKGSLKKILRLPVDTPDPFVYLISGSLPLSAHIHLRQLSLVIKLNQLGPSHTSFIHATLTLTSKPIPKWSWWHHVSLMCIKYDIPPLRNIDIKDV